MADAAAKVQVGGGGRGGYVAAIRAGQLGLDVVLAEEGGLNGISGGGPKGSGGGGTCLNVGCIPSKAMIHAADAYWRALEQSTKSPFGLKVEKPTIDLARTVEWKDGIVGRLTSGVGTLLKRHRAKIPQGHAAMLASNTSRLHT